MHVSVVVHQLYNWRSQWNYEFHLFYPWLLWTYTWLLKVSIYAIYNVITTNICNHLTFYSKHLEPYIHFECDSALIATWFTNPPPPPCNFLIYHSVPSNRHWRHPRLWLLQRRAVWLPWSLKWISPLDSRRISRSVTDYLLNFDMYGT